jgi:hypothetical protein
MLELVIGLSQDDVTGTAKILQGTSDVFLGCLI